ncbi:MAG: hypothetical protein IH629_07410, partial [Thermoleophilia bacterium]|nr:hypothetical protein [Thermoleophilia bacterium]
MATAFGEERAASRSPASRGGVLQDSHPIRRLLFVALAVLCATTGVAALAPASAGARSGELQQDRAKARELAADISPLDAQIGSAVTRYSRATRALEAVREQLVENRRLQRLAYRELGVARETLATRAVAMYKHDDVSPLDAVLGAADLSDLVTQLTI